MKLTRKHLNQILLQLPHPSLVIIGQISPVFQVPIHKELAIIHPDTGYSQDHEPVKTLTFEYSHKDMDWVLKNLEL